MKISCVIHTKNSQKTLKRALKSVKWCDEIVIIDMESTDNTIEIAKAFTDKIFSVRSVGFADPLRNFGVSKTSGDWVLVLDSDEEILPALATTLRTITSQPVDVWQIPRKNIIFDKWIQHTGWWPDYQYHFFKKGCVKWTEKVHTHPEISGIVSALPSKEEYAKMHYNYDTVESFIDRLNRYTTIQAMQQKSPSRPLDSFSGEFARRYVLDKGYLDGYHGYTLSLLQSFYQLVVSVKKWQLAGFPDRRSANSEIDQALHDLLYWRAELKSQNSNNLLTKIYWRIRKKLFV